MAGIPGPLVITRYRGLASPGSIALRRVGKVGKAGRIPAGRTGAQLVGSVLLQEIPARLRVGRVEQRLLRSVDEVRVAVVGFPVGEGELGALHDGMYVFGGVVAHGREVEPGKQGELLEEHWSLAPGPRLADRVTVVVQLRRVLQVGRVGGEVFTVQ